MAGRESSPTVEDFTGKLNGISIRSSGGKLEKPRGWKSPASETSSSSPASDQIVWRGNHTRRHRSPMESTKSNGSIESLEGGGGESGGSVNGGKGVVGSLSREQREVIRFSMVGRKRDFKCLERVNGRLVNVLEGLELHTGVFSGAEQKRIVDFLYEIQEKGRNRQLRERTYSEPRKWMRGKGRITIQFGCCYNYATDKNGNPPGIIRDEEVDPIPSLLKSMIKRMVAWHVLPPTCIPNSCIVNIYDKDDCIPPHIDHHDFVRPFCTISFLSECNILFGTELKVLGPGEFSGSTAIPLPVGSVLILNGNGADIAKHCVPAVPAKRISITFRKMDDSKLPFKFLPDPELQNLRPLPYPTNGTTIQQVGSRVTVSPVQQQAQHRTPPSQVQEVGSYSRSGNSGDRNARDQKEQLEVGGDQSVSPFQLGQDDFPPLGSSSGSARIRKPNRSLRQ